VSGDRRRLIVVSNRGPVVYGRDAAGERVARRGGGGLVTALGSLVAHHDVTWLASALSAEDRAVAAEAGGEAFEERARDGSPFRQRLIVHDERVYALAYGVVANPVLWFLQHGLWELLEPGRDLERAWAEGYVPYNRAFAETVAEELERAPDAAVFFHDYHLYLAPRLVRERLPGARLGHFVHIPWPEPDAWGRLPGPIARAIHDGLAAADVVGFHTARWRDAYVRSCASVLGKPPSGAAVVHPISVDPAELDTLAASEAVLAAEAELVANRPELLVVRVDRTDPSKNVVRGFDAFGLLLERHPELSGRVRLLALLDPSRQEIPEYAAHLAAIEAAGAALSQRFPGALDLRLADDFPASVAAYKQADVVLVNPVCDGLNLVAKEAPLVNARDGALVLSRNAGAYEELAPWVVGVDPYDIGEQADALAEALALPSEERRRRLDAIRAHVRTHDLSEWIAAQLAELDRATMRA
jgi:trehalose 6-phosphate synthase